MSAFTRTLPRSLNARAPAAVRQGAQLRHASTSAPQGGSSAVPLAVAAAAVLGGGAYWYSTSNAKPVQSHEVTDTVAGKTKAGVDVAADYAASAEQKIRSLSGKAESEAEAARVNAQYYGNKLSGAAHDAKVDAENLAARAKWEAEHAAAQVKKHGESWLSWTAEKKDAALSAADRKLRDAQDAIYSSQVAASRSLHRGTDKVASYGESVKRDAEDTYDAAVAKGQKVEKEAAGWFGSAKKSVEQTADEVAAEARAAKNNAARSVHDTYDAAGKKVEQAEDKAAGWFGSAKRSAEETAAEAKAKAQAAENAVYNKGVEVKEDAKATGSSWLSFGAAKKEEAKDNLKYAADQTQDRVYEAENRASRALHDGANRASQATGDAEAYGRQKAAEAKAEGSSWFNWFGAKKDEAKDAASRKAYEAEAAVTPARPSQLELMQQQAAIDARNAKAQAHIDADKVRDYTHEKTAEAKSTASSWLNFGAAKADDASTKVSQEAHGAKDSLKEGLLFAEKKVEHGAQHAQDSTRRL